MTLVAADRPNLTVAETAAELAVSERTVRRLIARGELPVVQFRRRGAVRIPRAALAPREQR